MGTKNILDKFSKQSKYDDETIKYIKKLKVKCNGDAKMARIKIKEKLDKKVSTKTILSFWE